MYERAYSGNIVIASEGPSDPEIVTTPYGEINSRSGARLHYVRSDAKLVFDKWRKDDKIPDEASVYLENPTVSDVQNTIASVSQTLNQFPQDHTGIDFYFAGHGRMTDGAWVLKDDVYSPEDLCNTMEENLTDGSGLRGISMMVDACYSGAFLIEFMIQVQKSMNLDFRDGLFSSLPHEKSWEMSFLEHGAFTFTQMYPGNSYVNSDLLTKAIEQNDHKIIAKYIQGSVGMTSNPTAFLTQSRQHPISVLKGALLSIRGYGDYSVFEESEDEPISFSKVAIELRKLVESYRLP